MNKLKLESPDLVGRNIEALAELFPNCVTEAADAVGPRCGWRGAL